MTSLAKSPTAGPRLESALFEGSGLVVSLPGREIGAIDLSGSVVEAHAVLAAPISLELRAALTLVQGEAARRGMDVKCVARPELFTHGAAESWLRRQTEGITRHICLSDGTVIKYLPGFQTHAFFYGRAFSENAAALKLLLRRAPELMLGLRGQVNSHFVLGGGTHKVRPTTVFLSGATPPDHPRSILWPFFLNRDSAEDSAETIARRGPVIPQGLAGFTALGYLPLTQAALRDRAFALKATRCILEACFDPATLLIIRLPPDRDGKETLARGIAAILPALRGAGVMLPRASPRNVFFAIHDMEENHPLLERAPLHMRVHESFDFWRHGAAFYARAARVTVLAAAEGARDAPGFLPDDVRVIYGPNAVLEPLEELADE